MKYIFLLMAVVLVTSCKSTTDKAVLKQNTGQVFGTSYNIQYESEIDFNNQFLKVFDSINQSMSTYLPTSDISRINRGDTLQVDAFFVEVFNASKKIWKKTNGYFDPTVGPLVNAYGFGPQERLLGIDSLQIDSILQFVGFHKLTLTEDNFIIKSDPRVFIDFNAIAKGYALDVVARLLDFNKIENYLIEIGGELVAKGVNPNTNNPWVVAIDDPTQAENRTFISKINLTDRAMASSGNYRKVKTDPHTKAIYAHSINPKTGWPEKSNVLSVTVLAETCMLADAYATAFMVMRFEDTLAFLENNSHLDALIVYADKNSQVKLWKTPGFKKLEID